MSRFFVCIRSPAMPGKLMPPVVEGHRLRLSDGPAALGCPEWLQAVLGVVAARYAVLEPFVRELGPLDGHVREHKTGRSVYLESHKGSHWVFADGDVVWWTTDGKLIDHCPKDQFDRWYRACSEAEDDFYGSYGTGERHEPAKAAPTGFKELGKLAVDALFEAVDGVGKVIESAGHSVKVKIDGMAEEVVMNGATFVKEIVREAKTLAEALSPTTSAELWTLGPGAPFLHSLLDEAGEVVGGPYKPTDRVSVKFKNGTSGHLPGHTSVRPLKHDPADATATWVKVLNLAPTSSLMLLIWQPKATLPRVITRPYDELSRNLSGDLNGVFFEDSVRAEVMGRVYRGLGGDAPFWVRVVGTLVTAEARGPF